VGCVSRFHSVVWAGITGTSWLLLGATALLLAVAASAAWTGYRSEQEYREEGKEAEKMLEARPSGPYVARSGLLASGLFAFIIVVESIPTFFYLQGC
jgi:hypothetical protein